ncbi:MAG: DUF3990 domain-containing protein [Mogibacterium sp.]|nr:DUF3990 domain-containing protein [Mogibacterium sp.]
MAVRMGVSTVTLNRWENKENSLSPENLKRVYTFAHELGIPLNSIKEQFYKEEGSSDLKILFHGAKEALYGKISPDKSDKINDFGRGFYMGESFRQAALFVSNYPAPSVYVASFNTRALHGVEYKVDREWLMTIAVHRGRLSNVIDSTKEEAIRQKVREADYVLAPIADNRMYQIIDTFIAGEITDEQCRHALAATNLGRQYVAVSKKAMDGIHVLERCYLCDAEKSAYTESRKNEITEADSKVKAARIKYRGKGKYIDELL